MKTVNQSMRKKDAMQLVTGQPVYMDDVIPQDCLIVKLLRSPHACIQRLSAETAGRYTAEWILERVKTLWTMWWTDSRYLII